jgi:tetratricopeptide (TPR) repeat protein
MNKENILFGIVGLLGGIIIGFMVANSLNRNMAMQPAMTTNTGMASSSNMPAGHPDIGSGQQNPELTAQIQKAVDFAKQNPNDFEAQIKAAELNNQAEKYEEAIGFLKIANKLKPDDYETVVNLGNVNFDGGRYEEAEKWYLTALAKKKDDTNVRTDLGLTFVFRGKPDYDRAIQEFNIVLAANPNHIQALQNSIVAYLRKGDSVKAKENLAKLETVDPTNAALPRLKAELEKPSA